MDISVAKRCLELLLFQECIYITDAMKFTNMYQLNADVSLQVFSSSSLMSEMRMYCAWEPHNQQDTQSLFNERIIHFLLQFQPGRIVRDIVIDGLENNNSSLSMFMNEINISKAIVFAQAHGILRRLHEFPIYMHQNQQPIPQVPTSRSTNNSPTPVDSEKQQRKILTFSESAKYGIYFNYSSYVICDVIIK